jgi:4-alpha-glucanotransferase
MRAAWASVAEWAVAPVQDLLGLGPEARMNYPSRAEGNWGWRMRAGDLTDGLAARVRELNTIYGRARPPMAEPAPAA